MTPRRVAHLEGGPRADAEPALPPQTAGREAAPRRPRGRPSDVALVVLAVLAVVATLNYLEAVVIPIVLAVLVSYALEPPVRWLAAYRVPRALGAALLLTGVVLAGSAITYALSSQAGAVVEQLPEAAVRLRQLVERDRSTPTEAIQKVQSAANELEKAAVATTAPPPARPGVTRVQVEEPAFNVRDYLMWGSAGVAALASQIVLVLFLAFFLLASGDLYRRKLVKIAGPSLAHRRITVQILGDINRQIEYFLLVQVATSAIVGVATWLAFRWLGLEQAAMWGFLAGIFNSIPYIGPVVVTGSTAVVAFLQFGTLTMAATVALAALAITSLEGFLLTPWLNSRAARMNAVAVFVGLIFWGSIWSIWGMLLAVPMMMMLKAVCDHVEDLKPAAELLGE